MFGSLVMTVLFLIRLFIPLIILLMVGLIVERRQKVIFKG
jgi:hypothetical protein